MLPKFMSSFMVETQEEEKGNNHNNKNNNNSMDVVVGLRLLTSSSSKSNVLVKSSLLLVRNKAYNHHNHQQPQEDYCFLKTCNLCNKQLRSDKDIYMYRGDQGFCSIECRNRQIVLDDMRELENSTKQMVASYNNRTHHCCNDARLETRLILEDLRMQRLKYRF
ncbi:FCS-Like Zinc finger 17-like [Arachis stenosperma]|uniref:FCS-Like Zinc finger 17-like n=1 Tax=Arachis stenosperma TaxID=217475 RepID=UPI0025ABE1C5|nr:FCS-Like Zinc finger 17-like [Arachis stenosperma]